MEFKATTGRPDCGGSPGGSPGVKGSGWIEVPDEPQANPQENQADNAEATRQAAEAERQRALAEQRKKAQEEASRGRPNSRKTNKKP